MRLFGAAFAASLTVLAFCGSGLADDRRGAFALPLPDWTPGAVGHASVKDLCSSAFNTQTVAVAPDTRATIFDAYGIDPRQRDAYVIDWLVPADLGGSNVLANLWPELTVGPLSHADKSRLQRKLRRLVCGRRLKLKTAQDALMANWVEAYERYVGRYP